MKDVPEPENKEDEILVRVVDASICGTDVGIYDWSPWAAEHVKPPIIIGHEVLGEVLENKGDFKKGDLVSSETHIFCGKCPTCLAGNRHICERMELFGISRNGSFAEKATIPLRTTWKNDPSINHDYLSVMEPFGNAVHVVDAAQVKDKKVLVAGLGPVGLCAGTLAKLAGAKSVLGFDISKYRSELAQKMGIEATSHQSLVTSNSFDVVLEMAGVDLAIITARDAVKPAGLIIAFGLPKKEVSLEWGKLFIDKEITIKGIFGRHIWETWEQAAKILKDGQVDLSALITHRFALKDFERAMAIMKSGECGKILLTP